MGKRGPKKIPLEIRFQRWTNKNNKSGCWIWTGKIDWAGYGHMKHEGRDRKAATVAYEFYKESIPKGLVLDHLCRRKACVNPDHLEAVTQKENWDRGNGPTAIKGRKKFFCDACGNPYEVMGKKRVEYGCRACRAQRAKEWRDETGYSFSAYFAVNRDRLNAQRRKRRKLKQE